MKVREVVSMEGGGRGMCPFERLKMFSRGFRTFSCCSPPFHFISESESEWVGEV